MILDAAFSFSTPSGTSPGPDVLALGTGTYYSGNVVDIGLVGIPASSAGGGARDLGVADTPSLKILVEAVTAFTSGGSATLTVNLQGAPDNGSGAPGTWYTMISSPAIAVANLTAGAHLLDDDIPRPPPGQSIPRFLRLSYVIATAAMTAGSVVGAVVLDRFDQITSSTGALSGYPAGITIAN